MSAKTVVFSMKVFDLAHFIVKGKYLDFLLNIYIPVDIHVKAVAVFSRIVSFDLSDGEIRKAWMQVLSEINKKINSKNKLIEVG